MGAVDTPGAESRGHKKATKKRKKKRVSIRIDMTPMVDVAFLLLTFFMLTTVFNLPQTMEINLPRDESKVEVPASNLLTLRIAADGTIFWNMGTDLPAAITLKDLRPMVKERATANPKLITLIKVDRDGTYAMMVDVMDELNLAEMTRFSLAPMLPEDLELLKKLASS